MKYLTSQCAKRTLMLWCLCLIANLVYATQASASELVTEAYGISRNDAIQKALLALRQSLLHAVVAARPTYQSSRDLTVVVQNTRKYSELPLLGVETKVNPDGANTYHARAIFPFQKVLPIYHNQLKILANTIIKANLKNSSGPNFLLTLLADLEQYSKLASVAYFLGDRNIFRINISENIVRQRLNENMSPMPSIDLAIRAMTHKLPAGSMYVFPAIPSFSHEVTKWGRVLRDKMTAAVVRSSAMDNAEYLLRGDYQILQDRMYVTYRVTDQQGNTIAIRIAALAPKAYLGMGYQPRAIELDQILHRGAVTRNDFEVSLSTNHGSEALMFVEGEELELRVKVNRPGYFFAVSHVSGNSSIESYLMEISDNPGLRRFVRYIGKLGTNRWIDLGKFTVGRPFGVESIQVIASNEDLVSQLPAHKYDEQNHIYRLVVEDASNGVLVTRSLRPKRNRIKNIESAETVLMMTIMQR